MSDLIRPMPRPPANVVPYVDALGPDLAVRFLLAWGGAELHMTEGRGQRGAHVAMIGADGAAALAARLPAKGRVPLANRWLAKMLAWQGHPVAEVARQLRTTDVTVRTYLADPRVR